MEDLLEIVYDIRVYTNNYRKGQEIKNIDYFFLSMLDICTNLVELGVVRNRPVTDEEEHNWFKGSYHLDFWDSEINNNLYIPLIDKVQKLNYFRK